MCGTALAPGCPPLRPWDFPFAAFTAAAATSSSSQPFQPYIADAYDTTNVLFSSGTTVSVAKQRMPCGRHGMTGAHTVAS